MKTTRLALLALAAAVCCWLSSAATVRANETKEVTFAYQHGLTYLPFMVMDEQNLVEKHTKAAGLTCRARFVVMGGPAPINDALVTERANFGAVGVPSLVQLWSKTKDRMGIKAIGSLTSMPMFLNTINPNVKSLKDISGKDKIALPSVKVSVQAVTLQMAAAQAFGKENYASLDKYTVSLPHPDATAAMLSASGGLTCHLTAPPFQYQQLRDPKIRKILSSYDVLGGKSTFVLAVSTEKFKKENPKTFDAVVKALNEAQDWINANHDAAADMYLKMTKSKEKKEEITAQMSDPEIEFTVVPKNIFKYAEFMNEVDPKNIKHKAASWKDLCFSHLHDKQGS